MRLYCKLSDQAVQSQLRELLLPLVLQTTFVPLAPTWMRPYPDSLLAPIQSI